MVQPVGLCFFSNPNCSYCTAFSSSIYQSLQAKYQYYGESIYKSATFWKFCFQETKHWGVCCTKMSPEKILIDTRQCRAEKLGEAMKKCWKDTMIHPLSWNESGGQTTLGSVWSSCLLHTPASGQAPELTQLRPWGRGAGRRQVGEQRVDWRLP